MEVLIRYLAGLFVLVDFFYGISEINLSKISTNEDANISSATITTSLSKSASTSSTDTADQKFQENGSSATIGCGQTISENTILHEDLTCPPDTLHAIVIGAPNIILDLGGHVLKGYASSTGVFVQDTEGIIIRNGTIDGFNDGIFLINTRHVTMENMTVKNQDIVDPSHFIFGVHIDDSKDVLVKDSLFEFPSVAHKSGVEIFSSDVVVSNIDMHGGGAGVSFSFVETCDPAQNPSNGKIINSRFSRIYIAGIYIACSSSVQIVGNDISTAPGVGVGIQGESQFFGAVTGLTVEGNLIHGTVIGIEFRGIIDSVISHNIISDSDWGIAMRQSLGCLTSESGWDCHYSTNNVITENQALENSTDLYSYQMSTMNTWEQNTCKTKEGVDIPECVPAFAYALLILKSGTGNGTIVSAQPGIDCGSACFATFQQRYSVTLTATPDIGSTFIGWTGNSCSGMEVCTVNIDTAKSVSATFAIDKHMLFVVNSGTGIGTIISSPYGIECGDTCSATYAPGTLVTLTAKPSDASIFTGWGGACTGTTEICAVELNADKAATARFAKPRRSAWKRVLRH
jgi:hypothetical protein